MKNKLIIILILLFVLSSCSYNSPNTDSNVNKTTDINTSQSNSQIIDQKIKNIEYKINCSMSKVAQKNSETSISIEDENHLLKSSHKSNNAYFIFNSQRYYLDESVISVSETYKNELLGFPKAIGQDSMITLETQLYSVNMSNSEEDMSQYIIAKNIDDEWVIYKLPYASAFSSIVS